MGRLGTLMQQGLDLWAETHGALQAGRGREGSTGWDRVTGVPGHSPSEEGAIEKSREAAGSPTYLIFNRRQETCQLAELGHHVDRIGLTRHLVHESK